MTHEWLKVHSKIQKWRLLVGERSKSWTFTPDVPSNTRLLDLTHESALHYNTTKLLAAADDAGT